MKPHHHLCRVGPFEYGAETAPNPEECRPQVLQWLSAVYQSEHLAVLVGNGFTTALAHAAGSSAVAMSTVSLSADYDALIEQHATASARAFGRGSPNIEDQIRTANQLIAGLRMLDASKAAALTSSLNTILRNLIASVLQTEADISQAIQNDDERSVLVQRLLTSFLLSFARRSSSRDRLNLFTTNYDRVLEHGCDLTGLRTIDRFVGTLTPVFRASRIEVDYHYSPPGIRGEPRYLDGVVRLTKLHGSLDWRSDGDQIRRFPVPFGAANTHPDLPKESQQILIYPNASKDIETSDYPYAELFRDFSAALCRPNSALLTYGYGFGDDHINRVLRDMLTLPSTHLVIISYDDAGGRVTRFIDQVGRQAQISVLVGPHFGNLPTLIEHYLPSSADDHYEVARRAVELERRRSTTDSSRAKDASQR